MMCTWITSVIDAKKTDEIHIKEKKKLEEMSKSHKDYKANLEKLVEEKKEAQKKFEKSEAKLNK